ncbi:type III-A CRISPR-associated protein Cas10/Csm1 [Leptothoe sp. ISB3NOV94-8A]
MSELMSNPLDKSVDTEKIACNVYQKAIIALLNWAEIPRPDDCQIAPCNVVEKAQQRFGWHQASIDFLRLIFDQIQLEDGTSSVHYVPLKKIECDASTSYPIIPYPVTTDPNKSDITAFKQAIQQNILPQLKANWNNFSWLSIVLEKYGGCVSYGDSSVALVDSTRIVAAVAVAMSNTSESKLCLIAGDLSGIQNFIYTITSDGALKSLRARSFYLELVTEEVVQQLIHKLAIPRSSVIYAGGGNLYLLAPFGSEKRAIQAANLINNWLKRDFQGKVFLSLACQDCDVQDVASSQFAKIWNKAIEKVNSRKTQKFSQQLNQLLQPRYSYTPCKVCHRDDQKKLYPLNRQEVDSPDACTVCQRMFRLGGQLFKVKAVIRSLSPRLPNALDRLPLHIPGQAVYYHLYEDLPNTVEKQDAVFLVNNWHLSDYADLEATPLILGNYGARGSDGFMTAQEFAEKAKSKGKEEAKSEDREQARFGSRIARVGYLRMDVDNLGKMFAKGLEKNGYSLPRLASLSRQMSYFFKVYLNSLACDRKENFLKYLNDSDQKQKERTSPKTAYKFRALTENTRQDLLFIYAGGDDLFVSGAWNQIAEFAFDVYQTFRAYTGNHPDITLSGGVTLEVPKFPLYQAASSAGDAEDLAKSNDRDSLSLFGIVFKWHEWLGNGSLENLEDSTKTYFSTSNSPKKPPYLGVWDFVKVLETNLSQKYKSSFIRNLLLTAQVQEQHIKEKMQKIEQRRRSLSAHMNYKNDSTIQALENEVRDIRYYLHLPKIAYTLARLPDDLRRHEKFKPMRISLLSPYNAPYFRAVATWIELLNRK